MRGNLAKQSLIKCQKSGRWGEKVIYLLSARCVELIGSSPFDFVTSPFDSLESCLYLSVEMQVNVTRGFALYFSLSRQHQSTFVMAGCAAALANAVIEDAEENSVPGITARLSSQFFSFRFLFLTRLRKEEIKNIVH